MTAILTIIDNEIMTHREASARRIKALMERWTANTLELGAELARARESFEEDEKRPGHRPGFNRWARQTTGLSQSHIVSLLQVHKKFGNRPVDAHISGKVMVLLSREQVPESARQEVVNRAEKGERVGLKEAKKIAAKHKLPTPKAANQQAKEEGHPVLASDGYIYFGTDPAKAKEGTDRRSMVYGVREALEHLGNIHLTGRQFLDYAFPHQLWTPDEAPIIKKALRWLTDLDDAWESRK